MKSLRSLLAFVLAACALAPAGLAQTAKSRATLYADIDTNLPSTTGAITAAVLRAQLKDIAASAFNTINADAQPIDADLTALAALAGTNTIYYRSAANTWSAITIGSGLTFSAGTLSASGGGGGGAWGSITGTLSAQTDLQSALDAKQPLTATLTALSGRKFYLVAEGDSMTASGGTPGGVNAWPYLLTTSARYSPATTTLINAATSGETAATMVGQYTAQVYPYRPAAAADPSYFFLYAGTNDLGAGTTAATIYGYLTSLWASARADGFRVVAFTISSCYDFNGNPGQVQLPALNALIRSDPSLYDHLVEPDVYFPTPGDSTYYNGDGIHFNSTATAILAGHINRILNRGAWDILGASLPSATGTITAADSVRTALARVQAKANAALPLAGGTMTGTQVFSMASGTTQIIGSQVPSGDTQQRFAQDASGKMEWGSGSAARDATLRRTAAGVMGFDFSMIGSFSSGTSIVLATQVPSADSVQRFAQDASGKMEWGSGSAARDLSFERTGAAAGKITGALYVTGILSAGTTPTTLTDSAGKILSAALNTVGVAQGGTGATSLTANNVLLGNGTSALQVVAPGSSGNVLTSNGTTWTSAAPTGGVSASGTNSFTGSNDFTGLLFVKFTAMAAAAVDMTKAGNTYSATSDATLTYSAATPTAGTSTILRITADATDRTLTIPTTWSLARGGNITTLLVPASTTLQVRLQYLSSRWEILGDPPATTGVGNYLLSYGTAAIANTKTFTVSNTLTLAGTDGTSMTMPGSSQTLVGATATQTLTNKRFTPRVISITSSATPAINTDNADAVTITALAANVTSFTTNLTGTPGNFDQLFIRIKDDGTSRTLAWGTSFSSRGATLPTATTAGKTHSVLLIYNAVTSTWDCVSTAVEA